MPENTDLSRMLQLLSMPANVGAARGGRATSQESIVSKPIMGSSTGSNAASSRQPPAFGQNVGRAISETGDVNPGIAASLRGISGDVSSSMGRALSGLAQGTGLTNVGNSLLGLLSNLPASDGVGTARGGRATSQGSIVSKPIMGSSTGSNAASSSSSPPPGLAVGSARGAGGDASGTTGGMDWKTIAMLSLLGIPIAGLGSYGAYKMMGGGKKRDEEKRSSVRDLAAEKLSRLLITVKQANALPAATEDFVQYMTTAAVKLPAEKVAGVVNLCRYVREGHSVVDALHKQNPSWTREQCKAAAARLVHAVYN